MKELICIVCPKGCHLQVDEENGYKVTGNGCPRGAVYGKKECTNPERVLTSVVRISGAMFPCCPVQTSSPVPKGRIFDVMKVLDNIEIKAPVKIGDIIVKNVCGTGADWIATREMNG